MRIWFFLPNSNFWHLSLSRCHTRTVSFFKRAGASGWVRRVTLKSRACIVDLGGFSFFKNCNAWRVHFSGQGLSMRFAQQSTHELVVALAAMADALRSCQRNCYFGQDICFAFIIEIVP